MSIVPIGPRGQAEGPVVIVGLTPVDLEAVREVLRNVARVPDSLDYLEADLTVVARRPQVVVIGLDQNLNAATRLAASMANRGGAIHLVALSSLSEADRIRRAMRAGFKDYVVLPEDSETLRKVVVNAVRTPPPDTKTGRIVAICGAKGGSGATLVAINLAALLADHSRTMLIDLDLAMGDVGILCDVAPATGVLDVLRSVGRLDAAMLDASASHHWSGMKVITQPVDVAFEEVSDGSAVITLLRVAAQNHDFIIVDCGSRPDELGLTAISAADDILLVTSAEVPSVRDAWRVLKLLERIGLGKENVKIVVNRWSSSAAVPVREIETILHMSIHATLSDDPRTVTRAVTEGRLFRDIDPKAPITRDMIKLAAHLRPMAGSESRTLLSRFKLFG